MKQHETSLAESQVPDFSAQMSLGEVLLESFPKLFDSQISYNGDLEIVKKKNFEVIIQGVEADL